MHQARGFTLIDLAAVAAVALVGGAVAEITIYRPPSVLRAQSLANMQQHGVALAQYRADNAGYLPIGMVAARGMAPPASGQGWCTWSHAGKNNDAWWPQGAFGQLFDVEAADRPLNAYLYPGFVFTAPPPPATLPATAPSRRTEQAPLNRDPADRWTTERTWPNPTKGVSTYDDIGTSYVWQSDWIGQIGRAGFGFAQSVTEGARRLAVGQGVTPSRFVWELDPFATIVTNRAQPTAQVVNWYGEANKSIMLFMDGHTGYHTTNPGRRSISYVTTDYTFIFDDLPNPGMP